MALLLYKRNLIKHHGVAVSYPEVFHAYIQSLQANPGMKF